MRCRAEGDTKIKTLDFHVCYCHITFSSQVYTAGTQIPCALKNAIGSINYDVVPLDYNRAINISGERVVAVSNIQNRRRGRNNLPIRPNVNNSARSYHRWRFARRLCVLPCSKSPKNKDEQTNCHKYFAFRPLPRLSFDFSLSLYLIGFLDALLLYLPFPPPFLPALLLFLFWHFPIYSLRLKL